MRCHPAIAKVVIHLKKKKKIHYLSVMAQVKDKVQINFITRFLKPIILKQLVIIQSLVSFEATFLQPTIPLDSQPSFF